MAASVGMRRRRDPMPVGAAAQSMTLVFPQPVGLYPISSAMAIAR